MLIYQLYKLASFLSYSFIKLLLLLRVYRGKEDRLRYTEKLGFFKLNKPEGKLLWFHAASVGEFNAILPIIKALNTEFPALNILITTVTLTAANIASKNLPAAAIHQFAPLDNINIIKRFLAHWQPDIVIWTESEFWPNMLVEASKKAKLLLINASISKRSFARWQRAKSLAKFIIGKFSLILAQSNETKNYLEQLGIENIIYTGNLKFIAANFIFDQEEFVKLQNQIKNRLVIMGASTHAGEEEMLANIHNNLKGKYPELLTILAPRHVERVEEVKSLLKSLKLNFVTRASKRPINNSDIMLVDTMGEFGLFYRLTQVVCIGGSWVRIGHNFIEPAKLKNLVIFGPNMQSSREAADQFLNQNAALMAANQNELEKIIENYLESPEKFSDIRAKGEFMVEQMGQIQESVLNKIRPYIEVL